MTQLPLQLPPTLEQLCEDARKRLNEFINRSAGQHIRAIKTLSKPVKEVA